MLPLAKFKHGCLSLKIYIGSCKVQTWGRCILAQNYIVQTRGRCILAGLIHSFFKFQVHSLKRLGFRAPFQIFKMVHTAETFHPFAISLHESVNSYERTCDKAS